jgi:hypothetical protein
MKIFYVILVSIIATSIELIIGTAVMATLISFIVSSYEIRELLIISLLCYCTCSYVAKTFATNYYNAKNIL